MANYKIRGTIIVIDDIVYIQGNRRWNLGDLLDIDDEVYIEITKKPKPENISAIIKELKEA